MIPSNVMLKLRKSKYLENDFIYTLKVDESIHQYEVFEKVLTTMSKIYNVEWKKILKARNSDINTYTILCESVILIDKLLRIEFRMSLLNRETLLGDRFNDIVRDYYKYL
jgi:hypothetical protein